MGSQRLWALLCLLFVPSASSSYNIHRFYQIQEQTPCQPWTVDPSERCSYVIDHADACYPDGGWQMYLRVHFCTFGHWQWVSHMILILGALLAFGVLLTISERFFCPALELISEYLRMPPVVAGATLLSFGNGAPDIFTQVAAVGQGGAAAIGMALAEPLGGGLFASNIVFGSVVLVATSISNVKIQKVPFFKDVGFYLLSLLLMAALLADHKAELWEALLMCGVYATYVFVTFWVSRNDEPVHADLTLHEVPQEEGVDVPDSCSEVFSEQPEFVDAGTSMTPLASTTAGHFSTTPRKNGTPRGCTDWTQHSALLWRPRHPLKEPLLASGGEALPGQPGNHAAAVAEATTSTADAAECGVVACNAGSSNSVQGGSPRNGLLGASPCAASPRSGLSGASPYAASPRAGLAPAGGDAGSHTVSQSDTASPSARAAAARQFKRFQSFPGAVSVHVQHPDSSISGTIGGLLSPRVSYGADNLFSPTSAHSLASSRPSSSMGYQARPGLAPLVQQMQEQHLEQQQDLLEAQFEEHLVLVQQHEEEQEVKKKGFSWKHRLQNPLMQVLMCTMPRVGTGYGHHYQRWRACVLPLTAPLTVVLAAPSLATSISPAGMGFGAVCAAVGATIIWATYPASNVPRKYLKGIFAVMAFSQSIVWLNVAASSLVQVCVLLGVIFGVKPAIMGATVLAWGNSVPDLINNLALARDGFPSMAVAACFASPMFTLLVGIGSALAYGSVLNHGALPTPVDGPLLVMIAFGMVNLVKYLIMVPLVYKFRMKRALAVTAFLYYACFNIVYGMVIAGVIKLDGLWQ